MMGIYKITNLENDKSYIGQSTNVEQRINRHLTCSDNLNLRSDIEKFGINRFITEILEECDYDELDEREDYYIRLYDSIDNGYNKVRGGQHNVGESNSHAKLTEYDVYDIREAYKNHESKIRTYERYKDKVSFYYFSNLWEGHSWKYIMPEIFTEENKDYYSHKRTNGQYGSDAAFTDEEVLELRKRYVNETAKQIYESVKDRCGYQTLQQLLWGRRYKDVPVYDKKLKKWIYQK